MLDHKKEEAILELLAELRMSYGVLQLEYERLKDRNISLMSELSEEKKKLHDLNTKILEMTERI